VATVSVALKRPKGKALRFDIEESLARRRVLSRDRVMTHSHRMLTHSETTLKAVEAKAENPTYLRGLSTEHLDLELPAVASSLACLDQMVAREDASLLVPIARCGPPSR